MEHPLLIKTPAGKEIILNEDQICSVKPKNDKVVITMSNGENFECTNYKWLDWLADCHRA